MRIKHHIAVVVLVCLVGGLGLSIGLAVAYQEVSDDSREVGEQSLALRDLSHLKTLVKQWFVSCDLVLNSGETYLAYGAKSQALDIEVILQSLRESHSLDTAREELNELSKRVSVITESIMTAANVSGLDRASRLTKLLEKVDRESTSVVVSLEKISKRTVRKVNQDRASIDARMRGLTLVSWVLGGTYLTLVVLVWRWSVLSLARPLRKLSDEAREGAVDDLLARTNKKTLVEISELTQSIATFVHDLDTVRGEAVTANVENRDLAARFSAILDHAADGIITIDQRGIIERFNAAAERIFGYSADEILGKNISSLIPMPSADLHDEYMSTYMETGVKKVIEIRREVEGLRKDGSLVPIDLHVSEVKLGEKRIFTGIVCDITHRKTAELKIRQATARAEEINAGLRTINNLNGALLTCRSPKEVAVQLTDTLVNNFGAFFARVWLTRPGDCCSECILADQCDSQDECLHLVASSGHYAHCDGDHHRVPLGAFKIGLIARGRGKTICHDVLSDDRVHDKAWANELGS